MTMKELLKKVNHPITSENHPFHYFSCPDPVLYGFHISPLHGIESPGFEDGLTGKMASGGETIIVTIDEKSLSELGRWPWPRTVVAKLVDQLKAYGAKAVGFDIIFAEPDENSSLKAISELSKDVQKNEGSG